VPVPFTVAVHCEVALTAIVAGVQAGETEVMVWDEEGGDGVSSLLLVLPPPHAVSASKSRVRPEA
jgi:Flp pilus assembly secretin CpaC